MINSEQREKITQILEKQNISPDERSEILNFCADRVQLGKRLERFQIPDTAFAKLLSIIFTCEYCNISDLKPSAAALLRLPEIVASRLKVLPLEYDSGKLKIAVYDPSDIIVINELKHIAPQIDICVVPKTSLVKAISIFYKLYSGIDASEIKKYKESDVPANIAKLLSEKSPVTDFLDMLLEKCIADNASDIHFEPFGEITRIRYRIDGVLVNLLNVDSKVYAHIAARIKLVSNIDIAEKRHPQDGRMFYSDSDFVDIRVSTLPTIHGEKIVLRLLKQNRGDFELEKLGFQTKDIELLQRAIKYDSGLILIAGPTGSGKSTTLHALMRKLNSSRSNLISIEDPVEYTIEGVNQVQVNDQIDLSFSNILRSVLRQDPDKIMIGEIRDLETAQLAVRAALTGHLVLSTVHANNTVSAVGRLADMGIPPYLIAASLKYVVAQRLVRKLCPSCKVSCPADEQTAELLHVPIGTKTAKAEGCEMCRYTGNNGRTVIAEILVLDNTMRDMTVKGATIAEMQEYAEKNGMVPLKETLRNKILNSEISADELYMSNID